MENSTAESYCADLVRQLSPDDYLAALFVPSELRRELLALYALDAELRHVHAAVSEEITAHIRYAWWQESLDQLQAGQPARAHPVVQAISAAAQSGALSYEHLCGLVHQYRISYPAMADASQLLDSAAQHWLQRRAPQAKALWQKAHDTIHSHGNKPRWLLLLKLYWIGSFG
ncbi:MAG: squalene/phytoene synthase family protein [Alphaproteobacteria bacterium]|nr:squalene/phytoene synthase family protein [Alphaproteobacteria bacterium]